MSVHSGAGKFCCAPYQSQLWAQKCISELTWCSTLFMRPGERQLRGIIPFIPGQTLKGVLWPEWVCWPLGGWSAVCHALPLTRLFILVLEILCWRGSLNKDMSPQKVPVLSKEFHQKIPSQLCAELPSRCSTAWRQHHSYVPARSRTSDTLTSPKTTALPPENKSRAADLPVVCSPSQRTQPLLLHN